jgi:pyridoxal 5'-phosphate synthase pdxT subunit
MAKRTRIGVLALQGDFAAHGRAISDAGGEPVEVRRPSDLETIRGLIIPGGESTTLWRLIREYGFDHAIRDFHDGGKHLFGTCAGLILLARGVTNPAQEFLGLLDVDVMRNAYGRQVDSFIDEGEVHVNGGDPVLSEMVFIRAPRLIRIGPEVEVIGNLKGEPTLVRQGAIWGGTFHPELSQSRVIHSRFVKESGGLSGTDGVESTA